MAVSLEMVLHRFWAISGTTAHPMPDNSEIRPAVDDCCGGGCTGWVERSWSPTVAVLVEALCVVGYWRTERVVARQVFAPGMAPKVLIRQH